MTKRRYLDEPDNPPIPSLNEYIAQRAAEERQKYFLEGSRNRTESYDLHRALNNEEINYLNNLIKLGDNEINTLVEGLSKNAQISRAEARHYLTHHQYPVEWEGEFDYWFNTYNDVEDQQKRAKRSLEENVQYLQNCIATATSNHPDRSHFVTGNQTFSVNPRKYGFIEIPIDEAQDGDLIQFLDSNGIGKHMAIQDHVDANMNRYLNYGPGDYPSYKRNQKDWEPKGKKRAYRYVGNHNDTIRWTGEYRRKYKLGGDKKLSNYSVINYGNRQVLQ